MIFVTGGAGFIGANFVLDWCATHAEPVVNFDKLTYAGNLDNLSGLTHNPNHIFVRGDIQDTETIVALLEKYQPRAVVHFAAESHVDRSILGPGAFIETNINGTFALLEATRAFHARLPLAAKENFRFLHVSTDEVYGSLEARDAPFVETSVYAPNSPYAASKAAADHLVRAWFHTYGLPTLTTNCSNNYGPYHFPEKLIPLVIANALASKAIPIYGDGRQVRDWLYVGDHCAAIRQILTDGTPGETYNIGGWNEKTNLEVVQTVCDILQQIQPCKTRPHYRDFITHVTDRPGHDRRYAIDARKIERTLGWKPQETFESGIRRTVQWFVDNQPWVRNVQSGDYAKWVEQNYATRSSTGSVA